VCGIVGIIKAKSINGKDESDLKSVFKDLLFVDQLRGMDSTGVYAVRYKPYHTIQNPPPPVCWVKKACDANVFLEEDVFQNDILHKWQQFKYVVGHNRYATSNRTQITNAAAHPYAKDHIVLVHNGTLHNKFEIDGKLDPKKDYVTDSESLTHLIAKMEIEPALNETVGDYSLVYTDTRNHSLNFIRNPNRPMYIATLKSGKGFVFASEKHFIIMATARHGLELGTIYTPKPYQLVSIFMEDFKHEIKQLNIKEKKTYTVYDSHSHRTRKNACGTVDDDCDMDPLTGKKKIADCFLPAPTKPILSLKDIDVKKVRDQVRADKHLKALDALTKKEAKIDAVLAQYGHAYGETVQFVFVRHREYEKKGKGGQIFGDIVGFVKDSRLVRPIKVCNVSIQDFNKLMQGYHANKSDILMEGQIINCTKDLYNGTQHLFLVLSWVTIHHVKKEEKSVVVEPPIKSEDEDAEVTIELMKPSRSQHNNEEMRNAIREALSKRPDDNDEDDILEAIYEGPNKTYVYKMEFLDLIKNGCCWCASPLDLSHNGKLLWATNEEPMCQECGEQEEALMYVLGDGRVQQIH
jgi:hypothetical protein